LREPEAYECAFCGARYDTIEFLDRCRKDDDGNTEFRCSCGSTEYVELYECKCCHGLYDPQKNTRLRWWKICNDCCAAVVREYNDALSNIADDYRKILETIYDIRPIEEV